MEAGDHPAGVDPAVRAEFGIQCAGGGYPDESVIVFGSSAKAEPGPTVGPFLNLPREAFDAAEVMEVGDARRGEAGIQATIGAETGDEGFDEVGRGAAVHAGV